MFRKIFVVCTLLAVLAAPAAIAEPLILELTPDILKRLETEALSASPTNPAAPANPDVAAPDLERCDILHEIWPEPCNLYHVVAVFTVENAGLTGATIRLEAKNMPARDFQVERATPQYHLDSGAIFEPRGDWNAENPLGESWGSVRPFEESSRTVYRWDDHDKDGILGVGDSVVLGTQSYKLTEVRIGVHLNPVGPERQRR